MRHIALCGLLSVLLAPTALANEAPTRALFFSKSTFFQHGPVTERGDQPSLAERVLREVLAEHGISLDATKEGSVITPESLAQYDLVIFYTQGSLERPGLDKASGIPENGVDALLEWIAEGGGFVGIHSATDTLRPAGPEDPATPYTAMIGGAFRSHGKQFEGTLVLPDPDHTAIAGIPDGFRIKDEWYVFSHLDTENIHVLAVLDPGEERQRQPLYDVDPYPVIWCKSIGEGRMLYNAMGHREDVWEHPTFQQMLGAAAFWATGNGEPDAQPNYQEIGGGANASTDD